MLSTHKPIILAILEPKISNIDLVPTHQDYTVHHIKHHKHNSLNIICYQNINYFITSSQLQQEDNINYIKYNIKIQNMEIHFIPIYVKSGTSIIPAKLKQNINPNGYTIMCGDWNARSMICGDYHTNAQGQLLENFINLTNMNIINYQDKYTFFRKQKNATTYYSKLDIALGTTATTRLNITSHTLDDIGSDHLPIIVKLGQIKQNRPVTYKILNYKRTDWPAFTNKLQQTLDTDCNRNRNINNKIEIDNTIKLMENSIMETIKTCTPYKKINQEFHYKDTEEVKTLKKYRNALNHHIYSYKRNSLQQLHTLRNKLNKTINYLIWEEKQKHLRKSIYNINNIKEQDTFWREVNKTLTNQMNYIENTPLQMENGDLAFLPEEKLKIWEKHYTNSFSTIDTQHSIEHQNISHTVEQFFGNTEPEQWPENSLITKDNLVNYIKISRNKSAPGPDGITNTMIKHFPEAAINLTLKILNACLKIQYFPTVWKHCTITSIPKPGKSKTVPGNYRPISLLSHLGKLLERKINSDLTTFLESNNILRTEQHGFRHGRSTGEAILRLVEHASLSFAKQGKMPTIACFFDMQKAFDSVWHEALLFRLIKYKLPRHIINIIKSYLSNRTAQAKINRKLSNNISITAGVPQGSILAPTLYITFINKFPDHKIAAINDTNRFTNKTRNIYQYADDTTIAVSAFKYKQAQETINRWNTEISHFCIENKMKINTNKSSFIVFNYNHNHQINTLTYQGNNISKTNSTRFLGIIINQKLTWNTDLTHRIKSTQHFIPIIRRLKRDGVSIESLIFIHKTKIRPILIYNPTTLALYPKTLLNIILKKDRKFLQTICKPLGQDKSIRTSYIYETYKIKPLQDVIQQQTAKSLLKLKDREWVKRSHPNSPLNYLLEKYLNITPPDLF